MKSPLLSLLTESLNFLTQGFYSEIVQIEMIVLWKNALTYQKKVLFGTCTEPGIGSKVNSTQPYLQVNLNGFVSFLTDHFHLLYRPSAPKGSQRRMRGLQA